MKKGVLFHRQRTVQSEFINQYEKKAGRSPSSFSSCPQVKGVSDERETLVLYAADGNGYVKIFKGRNVC